MHLLQDVGSFVWDNGFDRRGLAGPSMDKYD